jgi:hypothetical protein
MLSGPIPTLAGVASDVLAQVVGHAAHGRRCWRTLAPDTFAAALVLHFAEEGVELLRCR